VLCGVADVIILEPAPAVVGVIDSCRQLMCVVAVATILVVVLVVVILEVLQDLSFVSLARCKIGHTL